MRLYICIQKKIIYNLGYTHFFYTDGYDVFTNSLDISLGIRNKKRTIGTTIAGAYLFGTEESYQIVSNTFASITLIRIPNFAIRFRPNINFIIANQSITFDTVVINSLLGPRIITTTLNVFDLLNTQITFPISFSTNSWDFELGYNLNLPKALSNETDLTTTGFFNFSVGYMFDLNNK